MCSILLDVLHIPDMHKTVQTRLAKTSYKKNEGSSINFSLFFVGVWSSFTAGAVEAPMIVTAGDVRKSIAQSHTATLAADVHTDLSRSLIKHV